MEWHVIAQPSGSPESGELGMHLNLKLPAARSDEPASKPQIEAVKMFYQGDFETLFFCQAHALLACREYGRLCAQSIFPQYSADVQTIIAVALAAFALSDKPMVDFVVNWSEAAFRRGSGTPRVRGSLFFTDVENFAGYLDGMMKLNGWTEDHLKRFRRRL
jgi:hypothetical protein